jgi:hypothetical protein
MKMLREVNIEEEIRHLQFDTRSAQKWAREGKLEEWVHRYLLAGSWANPEFSEGLKRAKRWWNGPLEANIADLSAAVGTEPGMEFEVEKHYWSKRIKKLAKSLTHPSALPPLIVEYRAGELSVRDGNTRLGAMRLLGWSRCWVIIWYNSESDYLQHSALLSGGDKV